MAVKQKDLSARKVLYVVETEAWLEANQIFSTLRERFVTIEAWKHAQPNRSSARFATKRQLIWAEFQNLIRLLQTSMFYRGRWLFVCMNSHYSCLAFGLILRAAGRDPRLYLFNFYLHGLGSRQWVRSTLRFLLGSHVRILCQTEDEIRYFNEIRPEITLDYAPYCQDPLMRPEWLGSGNYVFAGGYSNRDYEVFVRCAERLPEQEFVIACSSLNRLKGPVPANVRLLSDRDWASFHSLLGHSKVVVVPLRERVGSSGQMVTLAAMEAGKPTIVPDVGGLSQYIQEDVTGFVYRLGDEDSLYERVAWCLEHPESLSDIGEAARVSYLRHFVRERFDRAVTDGVTAHSA